MLNPAQERDQDVVSYKGFAGLRNDRDPERFEIVDLEVATNVDIDASGRVARRAGRTSLSGTSSHSLWSDKGSTALLVQGTQFLKLLADYSTVAVATGLTAGLRMMYAKVNDRVYFGNGAQIGVFENGVVRSWGLAVPALPAVGTTAGNLPAPLG